MLKRMKLYDPMHGARKRLQAVSRCGLCQSRLRAKTGETTDDALHMPDVLSVRDSAILRENFSCHLAELWLPADVVLLKNPRTQERDDCHCQIIENMPARRQR